VCPPPKFEARAERRKPGKDEQGELVGLSKCLAYVKGTPLPM
jgi:hypothetical protein